MRIPRLQISFGLNMICIAVFNFLALVVTSDLSSAWRATIDTSRTIIIWSVSVYWFEWEYFHGLQVPCGPPTFRFPPPNTSPNTPVCPTAHNKSVTTSRQSCPSSVPS